MNLFEYLDRWGERRAKAATRRAAYITARGTIADRVLPNDFRGWLGFGLFVQSTFLFSVIAIIPKLQESQGFMTLASAVIVTGWVGGAAAFAYSAGKSGAERSDQLSSALRLAEASTPSPPIPDKADVMLKAGESAQITAEPERDA